MFHKSDILARLLDGDSVDTIASEMANTLNEAKAEADKLQKEAEERRLAEQVAKAKREEELKAKREALSHIVFEIAEYLGKYTSVDEKVLGELTKATDEDIDKYSEQIEALAELMGTLGSLEFSVKKLPRGKKMDIDRLLNFWF